MASDQAVLSEQEFSEKSLAALKENFNNSILSFCFNYIINQITNDEKSKSELKRDIISSWKNGIKETNQQAFKDINERLHSINADMLNIITNNTIPDIEDYQRISNANVKEVEKIFWKICGDDNDNDEKVTRK